MSDSVGAVVNRMALGAVNKTTLATRNLERGASGDASEAGALDPTADPKFEKLEKAAKQFEAIFVRQLLKTAKFGGKAAKGGHGQMAVDAMANAICDGGGLGLSDHIRDALVKAHVSKLGEEG